MPRSGFVLRQVGFSQSLGQIAANTNFFVVRDKTRNRLTVLQKHKCNVLIVCTVNAVSKIARCLDYSAEKLANLQERDFWTAGKCRIRCTRIDELLPSR